MLILKCVHLGSCPSPCQVQGSMGVAYPLRPLLSSRYKVTPGGTTTVAVAGCPALESAPTVTTTALSMQGPGRWEGGAPICAAWGLPVAGASLLSCALLASTFPEGAPDPGLCPPAPWAPGPAPLKSRSWGPAAPSPQSRRRSSHRAAPGAAQPPPPGAAARADAWAPSLLIQFHSW